MRRSSGCERVRGRRLIVRQLVLVILFLTPGIAGFKGAVVGQLQAARPYVECLSALLMVVAGSYIVCYWLFKGGLINSFS